MEITTRHMPLKVLKCQNFGILAKMPETSSSVLDELDTYDIKFNSIYMHRANRNQCLVCLVGLVGVKL